MKRLQLSGAMLGLTVLLTACPGPTPPAPPAITTHTLTVKLDGVPHAPVTVTNTTTKAQVFSGTLEGSKSFGDLKAGDVFEVEGGAVNGHGTPAAQTVTLDGNKAVTLVYTPVQTGITHDPARLKGTLAGWNFSFGNLYITLVTHGLKAKTPVSVPTSGLIDAELLPPDLSVPFLEGCTLLGSFVGQNAVFDLANAVIESADGDDLGSVLETTGDDILVLRLYAAQDAVVAGRAACGTGVIFDFDLNLKRGWNAVTVTPSGSGNSPTFSFRPLQAGATTTLTFERAHENVSLRFHDNAPVTLKTGESFSRDVTLSQDGGISGEVTLETNVPGVSVTPSTLNLPPLDAAAPLNTQSLLSPQRLYRASTHPNVSPALERAGLGPQALATSLKFTASETARPFSGPLEVIVRKNGAVVGGGTLSQFASVTPSVMANVPSGSSLTLARGETRGVTFNVFSQGFFSGSTTVTLSDLPAGVTASTETVTLTENGSAQVTVQVSASAAAPLGTVTARVTGPKVRNTQGAPDTLPVTVTPTRTALDVDGFQTAVPAPEGIWIITPERFEGGGSSFMLVRVQGGAVTQRETLTGRPSLLAVTNGDALLVREVNTAGTLSYTLTRLRRDGTHTTRQFSSQDGGQNFGRGVVDGQGNLWFLKDTSTTSTSAALARVNFEAGTVTVVDSTRPYLGHESLSVSPDGQTVQVLPYYNSAMYRVDTVSATVNPVTLDRSVSFFGPVAAGNDGILYLPQQDGVLRVSTNGTTTLLPVSGSVNILGLDRTSLGTLWLSRANDVIRLDTVTGTQHVIPLSSGTYNPNNSVAGGSPDASSGVWVITGESAYDQATGNTLTRYFASLLK